MRVGPVFIVLTLVAFARSAFAANPRAENAALDAISKAEGDFLAMNYASGAARLDKALRACAPNGCAAGTQAALLRDIGTMEFRAGDKGFAMKAFGEALKLQPNIDLNPSYDSPDLRAAWMELKGGPSPAAPASPSGPSQTAPAAQNAAVPPPPTFPQPAGDFMHVPAAEQKIDTPLPIFIEGGPSGVFHVIVRYKNAEQGDDVEWSHMDLARVGAGWGGVIPCNQVLGGTLRYYVQAFNKDMDPIATNGDAKTPYQVPIREELSGPPPHLPNRPAPKACHQAKKAGKDAEAPAPEEETEPGTAPSDCPPGMPGCGKAETPDDEEAKSEEESEGQGGGKKKKKRSKGFPRLWIGAGVHLDFMQMPSGHDLCRLQPSGPNVAQPANDKNFYCTDSSGNDFPTQLSGTQNEQLSQGSAGQSSGGIAPGNLRLMLSVDYAVISNLLIGARLGYSLFTYPGGAAVTQGYASGFKFYLEGRLTGVLGKDPLAKAGVAPILFIGAGASPFEAKTSDVAGICVNAPRGQLDMNPACNPPGNQPMPGRALTPGMNNMNRPTPRASVPVDLWITNGPVFVGLGGGLRFAPAPKVAIIGALRVNLSFGKNGLIPTLGPELDLQFGF